MEAIRDSPNEKRTQRKKNQYDALRGSQANQSARILSSLFSLPSPQNDEDTTDCPGRLRKCRIIIDAPPDALIGAELDDGRKKSTLEDL